MQTLTQSWESTMVDQIRLGDRVAFEVLCDTYRPILMGLALRKLRNSEDAADVVQETFLKAYRGIGDFDTTRPLKPWLMRICMNCIVDLVRSRKANTESLENVEYSLSDGGASTERADSQLIRGQIMEAIRRLPWRYRQIILMRHFEHMDVAEIANELKKPEGTIKSWLFRARAMLQHDLSPAVL